jgi:hypothetical protein
MAVLKRRVSQVFDMKPHDPVTTIADGIELYRSRQIYRGCVILFCVIGLPVLFVVGLITAIVLVNHH